MSNCPINDEPLSVSNPEQGNPNTLLTTTKVVNGEVGSTARNAFDLNSKIAAALKDYNAINSVVNTLIGYDFKWFRAVPQQRSKDVIFQEYTLSNVEECPLTVKGVVPNGTVPDSKYTYDLMGLEYEVPFEIQIDKRYWESIAGFGTAPQKKDIVYFVLENKLYDVESSYLFRGFMGQETTWKINLRKHSTEASRKEGEALKDTIDKYTVGINELFGEAINNDINKLTNDKQFSPFNSTSQDKYKTIDSSMLTISKSMEIYGTIVAQSFYDMNSPAWYNGVTYNTSDIITKTDNRAITAWIQPRTIPNINKTWEVQSIEEISFYPDISQFPDVSVNGQTIHMIDSSLYNTANHIVTLKNTPLLSNIHIDDTIVIARTGAINFYAKVIAITTNPVTYYIAINSFVMEDLITLSPSWRTMPNYKLTTKEPISIIDGVNDFGEHILSVNIYANQYIAISYGHTYIDSLDSYGAYVVKLDEKLLDNNWYGIVVNIGNSWGQYNVYVWEKHPTDKLAKIQTIFYETLKLYPEDVTIDNYTINKSQSYLTNLRLYNETIEEEKQSTELLSYFTQDGDKLILSDSADPIIKNPYITKQR